MGYMGDIRDIWIYVYARISDLACMHAWEDCKDRDWSSSPTLCDLGQGSPLSWAQSLSL